MAKSFWKIPASEESPRTPVSLLREQAAALGELTGGVLQGFVSQAGTLAGKFSFNLGIRVPSLNNYVYVILKITQPALLYPLELESATLELRETIENEEQLEAALAKILGSEEIQRIIAALRTQAKP